MVSAGNVSVYLPHYLSIFQKCRGLVFLFHFLRSFRKFFFHFFRKSFSLSQKLFFINFQKRVLNGKTACSPVCVHAPLISLTLPLCQQPWKKSVGGGTFDPYFLIFLVFSKTTQM